MGDIHQPTSVPLRARISHLFLERGTLHASEHSLVFQRESGSVDIPCGKACAIFLEPGTAVTHAAIKMCATHGTTLVWVGEAGVHCYSCGLPGGPAGTRLLIQAQMRLDPTKHIDVARRFHERMFGTVPPPARQIEKLRGIEGGWVKKRYAEIAGAAGIEWNGRQALPRRYQDALGFATSTLYGLCEAVIVAAGYSPSIGFIHAGDRRSLVFDLADTVKFSTVVPLAFEIAGCDTSDVRGEIRRACRDMFRKHRLIDTLFDNLEYAIECG